MNHYCQRSKQRSAGLTLLELMAATTIAGLVAVAALTSLRIGLRAWEKGQQAVLQLRRVTQVEDILHFQLSNHLLRNIVVESPNRRQQMPFFFAEERRLVFLTSYSALERGRGGIVVADYFAQRQRDRTWKLWLEERQALGSEQLAGVVVDLLRTPEGDQPQLRRFDTERALLLWEGLRECRFQYRHERPEPAAWVSSWSLLERREMPAAVALQVDVKEAGWRGLEPVPLYARLSIAGASPRASQ